MKKIFLGIALLIGMISCENQDVDFPDYTAQTVYFPIQYPVRTLVLGESRSDNSIDLEHAFSIGACVGGMYENTHERVVKIRLAPELVANANMASGDPVLMLPSEYYTMSSTSDIVIPKGEFSGTIRVDLKDAFFNDPKAVGVNYVLPLVITEETADSVLSGTPVVEDPDRRLSSNWLAGFAPRDYTLFAVKYINKYHGKYLHRGVDRTLAAEGGAVVSTDVYHERYVESDLLTSFTTQSLSSNEIDRLGRNTGTTNRMSIQVNGSNVVVGSVDGGYSVSGTGKLIMPDEQGADTWGGKKRMTVHLDYTYETTGGEFHHCTDTLVFRDNDMKFEQFSVSVVSE